MALMRYHKHTPCTIAAALLPWAKTAHTHTQFHSQRIVPQFSYITGTSAKMHRPETRCHTWTRIFTCRGCDQFAPVIVMDTLGSVLSTAAAVVSPSVVHGSLTYSRGQRRQLHVVPCSAAQRSCRMGMRQPACTFAAPAALATRHPLSLLQCSRCSKGREVPTCCCGSYRDKVRVELQ